MFDLNTGKGHWFYLKTDNILSVKLILTDASVFTTVNTTVFMSDGCSRSHRQQVRTLSGMQALTPWLSRDVSVAGSLCDSSSALSHMLSLLLSTVLHVMSSSLLSHPVIEATIQQRTTNNVKIITK